jgi:predicted negative regulator of RcsB-dependent stress response
MAAPIPEPTLPEGESPEPPSLGPLSVGSASPAAVEARRLEVALQGAITSPVPEGRAPVALLRARLQEARRRKDREAEREAAELLSRELWRRQSELDTASLLARRALALREDLVFREEFAGWLEGQGQHDAAAAELRRGLERGSDAGLWARVGDALARAGEAGAVEAWRLALQAEPGSFVLRELLGAVAFWQPEWVRPEVGAALLLDSSRERLQDGDAAGALEDRLRAAELAGSQEIFDALAELLESQGKGAAADEVLRRGAAVAEDPATIHQKRIRKALDQRDVVRAFGAALDADLDLRSGEEGALFDVLLDLLGLSELLVARAEIRAAQAQGEAQAEALAEVARLLGGQDGSEQRALIAWRRVLRGAPHDEEALAALERLGAPREPLPPVDEDAVRARLASATSAEMADLRLLLCRAARDRGDLALALQEALQILGEWPEHPEALGLTAVLGGVVGEPFARIEALVALCASQPPELRATVLAWASRAIAAQGDLDRARRLAERASHADPSSPRAAVALAERWLGAQGRTAAVALERAVALAVPSAAWCEELSNLHQSLGQPEDALAWAQRRVVLRPGDPAALQAMLQRGSSVEDAARLEGVLDWIVALAIPMAPFSEVIAALLLHMGRIDPMRAAASARRVLDAHGPLGEPFRKAVLHLAESSSDSKLAAACLERWLAGAAPEGERALAWQQAAHHHDLAGDGYSAARALGRALKEGAPPEEVEAQASLLTATEPEGVLAVLELRAECLGSVPARAPEAARLWREVGAARWGWAEDRAGMVRAWVRAAELEPMQGPARLVRDLFAFMEPKQAIEEMLLFAEQKKVPREASRVLSLAALAAFHAHEPRLAFDTAERAVQLDPSRAEALGVCEAAAALPQDIPRIDGLYQLLAAGAKGRFGRRAAHYRAARVLEGWGALETAARHALDAFEQVPTPGTSFALMTRLARSAGLVAEMIEVLSRVAAGASSAHERWSWWTQAAEACGVGAEAGRKRADLLLQALQERPDRRTVEATAEALVASSEPGLEAGLARLEEVRLRVLRRAEGPDGARVAVYFALAFLRSFRSGRAAAHALRHALEIDADIDEYSEALPHAQLLAEHELEAPEEGFVSACRAMLRRPFANVGAAVLRLGAHTATLQRNQEAALDLLLRAARRFDDDDGLIAEARLARVVFPDEEVGNSLTAAYSLPPPSATPGPSGQGQDERALLSIKARDARQAGDLVRLAGALRGLASLETDPRSREILLRELASLHTGLGEGPQARAVWHELLELVPRDQDALLALEQIAIEEGDLEGLASILKTRCEAAQDPEEARLLHLRLAALLEQRLGRLDEARAELEALLARQEDDPSATRFLADLLERQGHLVEAGTRWMRAFRHQVDPRDRTELAIRASQAFSRAGELEQARASLDAALMISRSERLLELRVELERAAGNHRALAEALDELAIASMASSERRAELLLEASHASSLCGDENAALERAQRAARVAPQLASAQLQARLLEYRARGAGTPQEAAQTVEELRRVRGTVPQEQIALHAFLLAEALDAIHGGNAGMRELSARHAELGAVPLLALGMAERLARNAAFQASLPFFDAALAGDLLGIRRRGPLALAAAEAAQRVEELDRARSYLLQASQDPASQATAQQRLAALDVLFQERAARDAADPRRTLQELALHAVGLERARLLAQLARLTASFPDERAEADRLFSEAILAACLDPSLRMELEAERDALRGIQRTSRPPSAPPPAPPPLPSPPPAPSPSLPPHPPLPPHLPLPTEVRLSEQPPESEPVSASTYSERITLVPGAELEVRQRFLLEPSRSELLLALRDAARSDHNPTHARALEHVLSLFSPGSEPILPPPLQAQREEPDTALRLLSRGSTTAAAEALALVWEGASQLFRRDPGTYGVTGLDRVALSGNTVACRLYGAIARVLGASRTPLFQRRSHGPVSASVALLVPPAVLLSGDPREESPELLFRLGAAFLAALPEHALIFGLPEAQLRTLLAALCSAFGPPEGPAVSANIASLAGSLWQTLPARAQRRLKELCANPADFSLERAGAAARRISHRAGLFLCGDLGVALREMIAAEQLPPGTAPSTFAELAVACEQHPDLLDLLAMAISPEFADARWQPGERVKRSPSGAFRLP